MRVNLLRIGGVATGLLLIPLAAMQFTGEVEWSPADFLIAWLLLLVAGLLYLMVLKRMNVPVFNHAVAMAVGTALLLIWMNGAVGIIGSADNDANLMYGGVLAVGIAGAFLARFRPRGMALALFATALAQAVVTGIAIITGAGTPGSTPSELVLLNGLFIALWAGSGWLFRRGAHGYPA